VFNNTIRTFTQKISGYFLKLRNSCFVLLLILAGCHKPAKPEIIPSQPSQPTPPSLPSGTISSDILIYGATSSGVIAAVEAAKSGKTVILIANDTHIGGMTSGGLSKADVVDYGQNLGGLTREFFLKVAAKYSEGTPSYTFEPKVALQVFNEYLHSYPNIKIYYNERLNLQNGVNKDPSNKKIFYVQMESGEIFSATEYVDASYEGDLLAGAGVSYKIGREANSTYNESRNGVVPPIPFPVQISPYLIEDNPASGLLPRINPQEATGPGSSDNLIMAYNYRVCLTNDPNNIIPITKPADLNMNDYEIMFRMIKQKYKVFLGWHWTKNSKLDVNSANYFSTDYVGMNSSYPEASYDKRDSIKKKIENYERGLIWLMQNDPRIPPSFQKFYKTFGLPKDEFIQNNGWPTQLYIREARRMVSDYVITDNYIINNQLVNDPIGLGTYPLDSHLMQYRVNASGFVEGEGQMYIDVNRGYGISYRALIPKRSECTNLVVSVCISASHSAFCSLRTEPTYMVMGQSAAAAAVLAINKNCDIQNVDYNDLKKQLSDDHQLIFTQLF